MVRSGVKNINSDKVSASNSKITSKKCPKDCPKFARPQSTSHKTSAASLVSCCLSAASLVSLCCLSGVLLPLFNLSGVSLLPLWCLFAASLVSLCCLFLARRINIVKGIQHLTALIARGINTVKGIQHLTALIAQGINNVKKKCTVYGNPFNLYVTIPTPELKIPWARPKCASHDHLQHEKSDPRQSILPQTCAQMTDRNVKGTPGRG